MHLNISKLIIIFISVSPVADLSTIILYIYDVSSLLQTILRLIIFNGVRDIAVYK